MPSMAREFSGPDTRAATLSSRPYGLVRAVRTGRKTTTTGKTAAMAIKPVDVPGSKLLENDPGGRDPASKSATRTVLHIRKSDREQAVRVLPPEFESAGTTAPGRRTPGKNPRAFLRILTLGSC